MHQLVHPTSQDVLQIFEVVTEAAELVLYRLEALFRQRVSLRTSPRPHNDTIMTPSWD